MCESTMFENAVDRLRHACNAILHESLCEGTLAELEESTKALRDAIKEASPTPTVICGSSSTTGRVCRRNPGHSKKHWDWVVEWD